MKKALLITASSLGLVLGASQLAAAAPTNGGAIKSAIDATVSVDKAGYGYGYGYRRHYRPYYRPYYYNY